MGVDGISLPLVILDHVHQLAGDGGQLVGHEVRQGLLHPVPDSGNGDDRRLPGAGLLPVLRVLGSDAAADVLPDRRVGRSPSRVCGHQVLSVYAAGRRADAGRDPDAVLQERFAGDRRYLGSVRHAGATAGGLEGPAHCRRGHEATEGRPDQRRTTAAHVQYPGAGGHGSAHRGIQPPVAVVGVPAAVHRVHHQGPLGAAAHVVARRACGSPDTDLHDSGRRVAEDGRLRHHSHLLSDLSARWL